ATPRSVTPRRRQPSTGRGADLPDARSSGAREAAAEARRDAPRREHGAFGPAHDPRHHLPQRSVTQPGAIGLSAAKPLAYATTSSDGCCPLGPAVGLAADVARRRRRHLDQAAYLPARASRHVDAGDVPRGCRVRFTRPTSALPKVQRWTAARRADSNTT